jgi:hypothetical protein
LNITGFIWLDEVVEKLARKHHVEVFEVEEAFFFRPRSALSRMAIAKARTYTWPSATQKQEDI